jgi:uncharacterized protein YjdB
LANVHELDNGDFIFAGSFTKFYNNTTRGVYITKTNSSGIRKWSNYINDSNTYFYLSNFIKINDNKFLLLGAKEIASSQNNPHGFAMMVDSIGNVLFNNYYNTNNLVQSRIHNAYAQSANEILLGGTEDTTFFTLKFDSLGNVIGAINKTPIKLGMSTSTESKSISIDTIQKKIWLVSLANSDVLKTYVAQFDYAGTLVKETVLDSLRLINSNLLVLPNNSILFSAIDYKFYSKVFILDSNLSVIWQQLMPDNCAVVTTDSSVVSCSSAGVVFTDENNGGIQIYKRSLKIFVKNIMLNGPNTITQKNGQAQFTPAITPTDAANQQLIWSISDTNIASITQTGLVTAKNNGMVTIVATANDGSHITSFKTITITNQTVGINELLATENQVTLYPNPAQNQLTVVCNVAQIQAIQLLDMSGKLLNSYTNTHTVDISTCAAGLYLVKVETDKGVIFKKLVISK